jgi:hypothetical protein
VLLERTLAVPPWMVVECSRKVVEPRRAPVGFARTVVELARTVVELARTVVMLARTVVMLARTAVMLARTAVMLARTVVRLARTVVELCGQRVDSRQTDGGACHALLKADRGGMDGHRTVVEPGRTATNRGRHVMELGLTLVGHRPTAVDLRAELVGRERRAGALDPPREAFEPTPRTTEQPGAAPPRVIGVARAGPHLALGPRHQPPLAIPRGHDQRTEP